MQIKKLQNALRKGDLTDASVKFAGHYVDTRFKKGSDVEKHLVLNTLAHGYFMGARRFEELSNPPIWKFWLGPAPQTEAEVEAESQKAATFYLRKRGYNGLEGTQRALVRATLSIGFSEGYRDRAKQS